MKFCTRTCYGLAKASNPQALKHLRAIAAKGKAGWTATSRAQYLAKMSGARNPAWRGGVTYKRTHGNYQGVKYVRCPPEFLSMARHDGYVMEHRLVMAKMIGRCLSRVEVVHHRDHNPANNAPENLELFESNRAHKLAEAAARRGFRAD